MAGNFNLTNVGEVFSSLVELGQNPVDFSDTVTILENVGHRLDEENERLFRKFKEEGFLKKRDIPDDRKKPGCYFNSEKSKP